MLYFETLVVMTLRLETGIAITIYDSLRCGFVQPEFRSSISDFLNKLFDSEIGKYFTSIITDGEFEYSTPARKGEDT